VVEDRKEGKGDVSLVRDYFYVR